MRKAMELRKALAEGRLFIGGHIFLTDPSITETLASFGYEFIWIDAEHAAFDRQSLLANIVAANGAGAAALVRVAANDPALIKPVLEMGPDGIIVPMVNTAEEAKRFVDLCRYPPAGARGFGPRRAIGYGSISIEDYLKMADASVLRIAQIELVEGVENLESILDVDGLDAIIIGPMDLSGSVGHLGQVEHPDVVKLYDRIVATCKRKGKPCGVSIGPGDTKIIERWMARGVDFISCGDDLSFIGMGARKTLDFIRGCKRTT